MDKEKIRQVIKDWLEGFVGHPLLDEGVEVDEELDVLVNNLAALKQQAAPEGAASKSIIAEPKTDELGFIDAVHELKDFPQVRASLKAQLRLYVEKAVLKGRIDELKEIQMADDLSDATKDVLYDCYINDRLKELHNES